MFEIILRLASPGSFASLLNRREQQRQQHQEEYDCHSECHPARRPDHDRSLSDRMHQRDLLSTAREPSTQSPSNHCSADIGQGVVSVAGQETEHSALFSHHGDMPVCSFLSRGNPKKLRDPPNVSHFSTQRHMRRSYEITDGFRQTGL